MTEKLEMLIGLVNLTGDLPAVPESLYGRLDGKLRSTDTTTAYAAVWLCWVSWDHRWSFYRYYLQTFEVACTFVRLTACQVSNSEEARAWAMLWLVYASLARLGEAEALPFECYRFARRMPTLLQNWPAAELQRRQEAAEAKALEESVRGM